MLFNSFDFAVFLPLVFLLYWFVFNKNLKGQNLLIVAASYLFYGWWDYRFLALILFSTLVDFSVGKALKKAEAKQRKTLLWVSIVINLGFLGFFKYFNFFIDSFVEAFAFFGSPVEISTLNIVLPVGISFYTFQTLSYTIDVYKRKLEPTEDFVAFAAFVSFFPQLVAGPIERATHLLPQFYNKRTFDYLLAVNGLKQILWGLFKKVVIADNCAEFANIIFNSSDDFSGSTLVLGAIFFTFQIYGDFSGYSDIAIGTSRLFGFDLMQNFSFPYFSRDVSEFWRRWHISLSTWFRDYLYIPLGGSKGGKWKRIQNTMIIFLVSGFWHGANWTFVVWGALNALYFLPLLLLNKNRNNLDIVAKGKWLPSIKDLFWMGFTFGLMVFAWIFFRAENLSHAFAIIGEIFSSSIFDVPLFPKREVVLTTIELLAVFVMIEWLGREGRFAIDKLVDNWPKFFRYTFYVVLTFVTIYYGNFSDNQFIYFQF